MKKQSKYGTIETMEHTGNRKIKWLTKVDIHDNPIFGIVTKPPEPCESR